MLVFYEIHSRISDKEEDLMFATEPRLFSIGTIVVPTLVWLDQPVKLITLVGLNLVEHVIILVEHVFESYISCNIPVKFIYELLVKIAIPLNTFQKHLSKMFFQLEVGEMEIDEMLA
jgi:hypothetical protein